MCDCDIYRQAAPMLTPHPLSPLTVSIHVYLIYLRHVSWMSNGAICDSVFLRCLLPLKFASRFFLCCGLKWREMVVVFSHFPSWSSAPTSNVNVLTVATRNKTAIKNMTLNSSTLRNLNNFQRVLWPVMFQEVRKSHFITRVHNTSPMCLEGTIALCCCGLDHSLKSHVNVCGGDTLQ